MVMKTACALGLLGVYLVLASRPPAGTEANPADFDAVCSRARQHLREGRCDEALTTIAALEEEVRANVELEPGRELTVLIIKARAYWHQMDTEGLERFLTQFEQQYADTSAACWVQRAAWYERMLGYRFAENLPRAVQAFEKYQELEEQSAGSPADAFEAAERDFDLHVKMPAEIGDLYRYMGRTDRALEKYRSALEYTTAHARIFGMLDANPEQLIDTSLFPGRYRDEILPTAIRECAAPQDSVPALLSRDVTCEVRQADWLLTVARGCCQRQAVHAAREHYRKAQQALAVHRNALGALPSAERTRLIALQEHVADNLEACDAELIRLSAIGF